MNALLKPLLIVVALIIVFVGAFNLVAARITSLIAENEEAIKTTQTLQTKLSSLESTQTQISNYAQSLIAALPAKNSSLIALSQAKSLAAENSLVLDNISVGSELSDAAISHVDVIFDVTGASQGVFSMIEALSNVAPISRVSKVKVTAVGASHKASVALTSYWAALPTQISAVSDPLGDISPQEQELLNKLGGLRQPQFLELTPTLGAGKIDPFSQ